nr:hypothetical protein [Corynebacterium frankenforstense]
MTTPRPPTVWPTTSPWAQVHASRRPWRTTPPSARPPAPAGLAERWLDGYLVTREPLPLSSNVSFQINLETDSRGVERLAEVVHAAARVHLAEAAGETGARFDARGNELAAGQ